MKDRKGEYAQKTTKEEEEEEEEEEEDKYMEGRISPKT